VAPLGPRGHRWQAAGRAGRRGSPAPRPAIAALGGGGAGRVARPCFQALPAFPGTPPGRPAPWHWCPLQAGRLCTPLGAGPGVPATAAGLKVRPGHVRRLGAAAAALLPSPAAQVALCLAHAWAARPGRPKDP
jgi:hypothetical protein